MTRIDRIKDALAYLVCIISLSGVAVFLATAVARMAVFCYQHWVDAGSVVIGVVGALAVWLLVKWAVDRLDTL
jgi:hypothetical protein